MYSVNARTLGTSVPVSPLQPQALADVYATALMEPFWRARYWSAATGAYDYTVAAYAGTENGVFRSYPGTPVAERGFDPREQPWYTRAKNNLGWVSLSPPFADRSGAGLVRPCVYVEPVSLMPDVQVMSLSQSVNSTADLYGVVVCQGFAVRNGLNMCRAQTCALITCSDVLQQMPHVWERTAALLSTGAASFCFTRASARRHGATCSSLNWSRRSITSFNTCG
jgi:hypothetical protein